MLPEFVNGLDYAISQQDTRTFEQLNYACSAVRALVGLSSSGVRTSITGLLDAGTTGSLPLILGLTQSGKALDLASLDLIQTDILVSCLLATAATVRRGRELNLGQDYSSLTTIVLLFFKAFTDYSRSLAETSPDVVLSSIKVLVELPETIIQLNPSIEVIVSILYEVISKFRDSSDIVQQSLRVLVMLVSSPDSQPLIDIITKVIETVIVSNLTDDDKNRIKELINKIIAKLADPVIAIDLEKTLVSAFGIYFKKKFGLDHDFENLIETLLATLDKYTDDQVFDTEIVIQVLEVLIDIAESSQQAKDIFKTKNIEDALIKIVLHHTLKDSDTIKQNIIDLNDQLNTP
jgi:hypothetical protein